MNSVSEESASLAAGNLWSARRIVVTVREPGREEMTISVDKPFARVGRDRRAEVYLDAPSALPCQLYLHATDDGIYCLNLSAEASSGWLTEGSTIELGACRLSAAFADDRPAIADLPDLSARHGAAGPLPRLTIAVGRQETTIGEVVLHRQLTLVGRQPPGTLCVRHRTISRAHCVLFWEGGGLWLVDLLSSNGTRLNGERCGAGAVPQGATFKLGDVRFHFVATTPRVHGRSRSDQGSGLLDTLESGGLPAGRETITAAETQGARSAGSHFEPRERDERFRELADELRSQRHEVEQKLAEGQARLAAALAAAHQQQELALGDAAERKQTLAALRQAVASLEEKFAQAEVRAAAASGEATESPPAAWVKRLQELDGQLAREQQERVALAETLAAREAAAAESTKQVAALRDELAVAVGAARQAGESMRGEAADREQMLAALRDSIASLEEKFVHAEAQIAAASGRAVENQQATASLAKRFHEFDDRLAGEQHQRVALAETLAAREAAAAESTKQVAALRDELAAAVGAAQQAGELVLGEAAEREQTLAALRDSIASLEEKLVHAEAQVAAVSGEASESRQAAVAWGKRFEEIDDRLAREQHERIALARTLAAREVAVADSSKQVAALRDELAAAVGAAQQAGELVLGGAAEREQTLAALRDSIASLEEKLTQAEAQVAALSGEATESRQAAAAWERRFQEIDDRLAREQHERIALAETLAAREETVAESSKQVAALRDELAALTVPGKFPSSPAVAREERAAGLADRLAAPPGDWLLDDQHTRRLLDFRSKREGRRYWRRFVWAAAASLVITAVSVAAGVYLKYQGETPADRSPLPVTGTAEEP
jgi:pSer/pThr/pTyr-binding forkhead associated (FHA) protein/chromosome segregation ATPase